MTQDAIEKANSLISESTKDQLSARDQIQELKKIEDTDSRIAPALKVAQEQIDDAKAAMSKAANGVTAALGALPPNGPIDSIAHQVSFVVTLSGNATPTWTLVRFKGPGTSNNGLLSGSRAFTHTLNISMGSPSDSGIGQVSAEQIRQLNNLHQDSAFRNALTLRSAVVGAPF